MSKKIHISTPAGATGLAVEPWTDGEIYAVAANWSQASSQIMTYGDGDWHPTGWQVADFRHHRRAALAAIIRSNDDNDDDEIDAILDDAVEIDSVSEEQGEIADVLRRHGDRYSGNHAEDVAQDWLDHYFDADGVDKWCSIGVWDAGIAARLRDAGLTPTEARDAADGMIEDCEDEKFADGDPIYAACNGDIATQRIIDAR